MAVKELICHPEQISSWEMFLTFLAGFGGSTAVGLGLKYTVGEWMPHSLASVMIQLTVDTLTLVAIMAATLAHLAKGR